MEKRNVLFLGTGNSTRSQLAEAFLRKYANHRFEVYSAGLALKDINPLTIKVMDEVGIDIRHQTSNGVKEYMNKVAFRYVITVCSDADENCPRPLWHPGEKFHWPFDDPAQAEGREADKMIVFRRVRDEIEVKVKAWVAELEAEPI